MKPVAPSTRGALRRHLKKHGPIHTYEITCLIKARKWAWPVKRVTQSRVETMLKEMGLFRDDETLRWRCDPPSIEERAERFLRSLAENKRETSAYDGTYYTSEGYNEAVDDALGDFKRLFPELVPIGE